MDKLMLGCCRGGMSSAAAQMMLSSIKKAEKEGHQVLIIDPEKEYQNLIPIGKSDCTKENAGVIIGIQPGKETVKYDKWISNNQSK